MFTFADMDQMLEKGSLLIIETGEYSDRMTEGPVRMLADYKKSDLATEYADTWKPTDDYDEKPTPGAFLSWLVATGKAEAVDCEFWHVGSYGKFEP